MQKRGKELAAPQAWDKENFFWLTGEETAPGGRVQRKHKQREFFSGSQGRKKEKKRGGQRSKSTKKNE